MATQTICDGCGGVATKKRGVAMPLDYCDDCVAVVDLYLKSRDQLHENIVAQWDAGLAALKDSFAKDHPDVRLPDG